MLWGFFLGGRSRMMNKFKDLLIIYSCLNIGLFLSWLCHVWFDFRDTTVQTLTLQPSVKDGLIVYEDSPLVSKRWYRWFKVCQPMGGSIIWARVCIILGACFCITGVLPASFSICSSVKMRLLGKEQVLLLRSLLSKTLGDWQGSSACFLRLLKSLLF